MALILFWFFDSDLKTAQSNLFSYPYQHLLNLFPAEKQTADFVATVSCKELITLGGSQRYQRGHDESLLNHKDRNVINKLWKKSTTPSGESMPGKLP